MILLSLFWSLLVSTENHVFLCQHSILSALFMIHISDWNGFDEYAITVIFYDKLGKNKLVSAGS